MNNQILKAESVHFKDDIHEPIFDCTCAIIQGFLVIENENEDVPPTWYNIDLIERMKGVETIPVRKMRVAAI